MKRDEKGRYIKGQSGNPAGRPKGSRNKYTEAMLTTAMSQLLEKDFNPVEELLKLYNTTEDEGLKHKILNDVLRFTNNPLYVENDKNGEPVLQEGLDVAIAELKSKIDEL